MVQVPIIDVSVMGNMLQYLCKSKTEIAFTPYYKAMGHYFYYCFMYVIIPDKLPSECLDFIK
jgi:hypothetical protein